MCGQRQEDILLTNTLGRFNHSSDHVMHAMSTYSWLQLRDEDTLGTFCCDRRNILGVALDGFFRAFSPLWLRGKNAWNFARLELRAIPLQVSSCDRSAKPQAGGRADQAQS